MTLVTATVEDVHGSPDNSVWIFHSLLREASDGSGIVTPKPVRVTPVAGVLSVNLDPGFSAVAYRGKEYVIEVTNTPADLWDLIAASVAFPPGTPPTLVAAAVMGYLAAHPLAADWDLVTDKPAFLGAGATQSAARAEIDAVGALPPVRAAQAVVCFTFDDAFSEDMTVVKPILDAAGIKAGFPMTSGPGGGLSPGNAGHLTWVQVKQLQAEGHEIIAHSNNHEHLNVLTEAQKIAQINNQAAYEAHDVHPRGFAYPFGEHDADLRRIVRDYWDYGLATTQTEASGSQSPLSTFCIRRIWIKDDTVTATHYAQIDTAIANGEILVFASHSGASQAEFITTGPARLAAVIAYAQAQGVPIVKPGEAFDMVRNVMDAGDYPGGTDYTVISSAGKGFTSGSVRHLADSASAIGTVPSAYDAGITLQSVTSPVSPASPRNDGGPGVLVTTIVVPGTGATTGTLNRQEFYGTNDWGRFSRSASADNTSWGNWKSLGTVTVVSTTSSATPTPFIPLGYGLQLNVNALAVAATFAAPSGTPVDGQPLTLRIKDNGTPQTLAFNAIYNFGVYPAPAITVAGQTLTLDFKYNASTSKWDRLGSFDLAATVHAASAKAVPVAADEFALIDSASGNALAHIPYADLLAAVRTGVERESITTGESTIPRGVVVTNTTLSSGIMRIGYFEAMKTETITQVRTNTVGTAAATPTLCRIGIYSIDGSGNLTLVASTATDTAMWASATAAYTKSLSSSWAKVRGTRYAVAALYVGTTAPVLLGSNGLSPDEMAVTPRLCAALGGQTDLPSSILVGSLSNGTQRPYVALLP